MELMNTVETNNQRIYDAGYIDGLEKTKHLTELLYTEITQEAFDSAGEEGITVVSVGDENLDLSRYGKIVIEIFVPDSSDLNTTDGLLSISLTISPSYSYTDEGRFLFTQGTAISTCCGINKTANMFAVVGVWGETKFIYGTVIKNGYRTSAGYAGVVNGWTSVDSRFTKNNKKYFHIHDSKRVFKFPVGTKVVVYGG